MRQDYQVGHEDEPSARAEGAPHVSGDIIVIHARLAFRPIRPNRFATPIPIGAPKIQRGLSSFLVTSDFQRLFSCSLPSPRWLAR